MLALGFRKLHTLWMFNVKKVMLGVDSDLADLDLLAGAGTRATQYKRRLYT